MSARTLVLTEGMLPHDIVAWEEAITALFNGKVRVLETYDEVLLARELGSFDDLELLDNLPDSAYVGDRVVLRTPAVMVLKRSIGALKRGVKFSRENVLTRDRFRCGYCGTGGDFDTLNYDHVVPRAQGGRTVWENIVAACYACNTKKANRTPEQAGMRLLARPHKPKSLPLTKPLRLRQGEGPDIWRPYLAGATAAA